MTQRDRGTGKDQPSSPTYAEFFGNIRTTGELLADDSKSAWSTSVPSDAPHHQYVVWLGCQVLRTAHLAETLNDVLNHLAVDHATLGGPSNCCGIVHDRRGDKAIGDNLTRQTVRKFDAFTPDQLLVWCPSCDNHLRGKSDDILSDTARNRRSVAGFLAEQMSAERCVEAVPARVAIHTHHGFAEQDADAVAVRRMLSVIPGLEIVEVEPIADVGRHCAGNVVQSLGIEAYLMRMRSWIDSAKRAGADRIVSVYHSCHRQMVIAQLNEPREQWLPVDNYLSLTARALGLAPRDDRYARFMAAEVDDIMAELTGRIAQLGIDPARARRAMNAHFGLKEPS